MKSRERVLRALEFDRPDRAPRELWLLPWANLHYPDRVAAILQDFPPDFIVAPAKYSETPRTTGDPYALGTFVDEWGCEFVNIQQGAIGEVKFPLLGNWDSWPETIRFPEEWLTFDRDAVNAFCEGEDRFVRAACCPRPFERLQFLRGTAELFMDLADPSPEFLSFLGRLHAFNCSLLEEWAKTRVDGLMFMDDWGAQRSLLISPKSWRNLFKPLYKDYIDIAHRQGKKIFMHSDGHILDIYPDLIELGLDAINSQVFCMGLENLSQFRGKITFWGEIDRQHLLPHGSREEVRAAVVECHQQLYLEGGVIAQCEFGLMAKPENVREVFRAWDELTASHP